MVRSIILVAAVMALVAMQIAGAAYTITHITTQVALNTNNTGTVRDSFTVYLTNDSVAQYQTDRSALNFTLTNWQSIVGPNLVQHIINPRSGVYNFRLFPGPLVTTITGQQAAVIVLSYNVNNVTTVKEIAPRIFSYSFNNNVFNFVHQYSGQVLGQNTTLTVTLPHGSKLLNVYPVPDAPSNLVASNFTNVTSMTWIAQEPLSKFSLTFTTHQSIQGEVLAFFTAAYTFLGFFTYIIIIVLVLGFILYTYLKVEK